MLVVVVGLVLAYFLTPAILGLAASVTSLDVFYFKVRRISACLYFELLATNRRLPGVRRIFWLVADGLLGLFYLY